MTMAPEEGMVDYSLPGGGVLRVPADCAGQFHILTLPQENGEKSGEVSDQSVDELPKAMAPVDELEQWLRHTFESELPGTLDKAVTYGSADLEVMGDAMGVMIPKIANDPKLKLLAAVTFYQLGKVARQIGALRDGREPPLDTNYDMHIYGLIGMKIQMTGEWLPVRDT